MDKAVKYWRRMLALVQTNLSVLVLVSNVTRTTLQQRACGRRSLAAKAQTQQYLTPCEEKALVKFLVYQDILRPSCKDQVRSLDSIQPHSSANHFQTREITR